MPVSKFSAVLKSIDDLFIIMIIYQYSARSIHVYLFFKLIQVTFLKFERMAFEVG